MQLLHSKKAEGFWASPRKTRPTRFTKIGSYELHCNPDILKSCNEAREESTSEVQRLTRSWGGFKC